jgi:hypothetical protein
MGVTGSKVAAGPVMARGFIDLFRRPFVVLLFLNILLSGVTASLGSDDDSVLIAWLLLTALTVYVQIATILAASSDDPDPRGDPWIRAAFKARRFWRFVAIEIFIFVVVALSLFLLVIGGLVAGAYVGLAEQAVVIERNGVAKAVVRSYEVGAGARRTVGVIFGTLVLLPNIALPLAYTMGADESTLARVAVSAVAALLTMAGTIALTHTFGILTETSQAVPR